MNLKHRFILSALAVGMVSTALCAEVIAPEVVAAECVRQMQIGVCISRPDQSKAAAGRTMILNGAGRVSYAAYADYANKFNILNPNDTSMCQLALFYMKKTPGSDHDKIARAMWTPSIVSNSYKKSP